MFRASLMKNSLFIGLILLANSAMGQFEDNFSDGDFTNDPAWVGETDKFTVTAGLLELEDVTESGTAYLATASTASLNTTWEFFHRYDSNPSTSNRAEVYLTSDQADLSGDLNGYFLRIGEQTSTTDQIKLFRQDGSSTTELLATAEGSALNASDQVGIRIRVERDASGTFTIFADAQGGTAFVNLGTVTDNTYTTSSFFGVNIKFSSSRSEGFFFFDDFSVVEGMIVDEDPPILNEIVVLTNNQLELRYNEALESAPAEDETNFNATNGLGFPSAATLITSSTIRLSFSGTFQNGVTNELTIMGLFDLAGNGAATATEDFTYFETLTAGFNDVIITEIHADPDESTPVPAEEFIELFNRTSQAIELEDWTVFDESGNDADLPAYLLNPGAYVVICASSDLPLFDDFGPAIGVGSLPSLNNSGDELTLRDADNNLIFHTIYDDNDYGNPLKADGGWSLEMIDTDQPCVQAGNWIASDDPSGGTPGGENSVSGTVSDETPIALLDVIVNSPTSITLLLSEKLDLGSITNLTIEFDNGLTGFTSFTVVEPQLTQIDVTLPGTLEENTIYNVTISGITDCNGNPLVEPATLPFGLPLPVAEGDLRINEILFNPYSGNVDFIELYNVSNKLLSTSELILAEADPFMLDSIVDFSALDDNPKLIFPNDFLVLSDDPELVKEVYFTPSPGKFQEVPGMPNYPDDEGVVILYRQDLTVLDQVAYSEDWHFDLLDDEDGVSLERISVSEESQDENNWNSASQQVGFATPAYMNSSTTEIQLGDEVTITPEVFSPDGDGFEDFMVISYTLEDAGFVGNVRIFDAMGREMIHLVQNETLGLEGFYKWDGVDRNGERVRSGLYIVLVDLFDLNGDQKKIKREVAITSK